MPISIKHNLVQFCIAGLGSISTALGYNYDVRHVYNPAIDLDAMLEFPSINVEEGPEVCDDEGISNWGNRVILHNHFDLTMYCILEELNNPRKARSKMLADAQVFFAKHWKLDQSAHASMYLGASPWGIDRQKPRTGITIRYRIWYRQLLTDPTTGA